VTRNLIELLRLRGYNFNRTADFETVAQIKEKFYYIPVFLYNNSLFCLKYSLLFIWVLIFFNRYCYVGMDLKLEDRLANETTVLTEPYEVSFV
jgi:actin-related protein 2